MDQSLMHTIMKKPNSLQFVLSAKKIISVNALYGAKLTYSGARPIATMYKKSEAKMMENYIKEQVKALDLPTNHPWITKDTKFKFTFTVIFKSGYFMRDLDNCCKNLIDGIFRALGYNDSHICEIHCYKTLCPDIPEEKICIEMAEYTGESRFDKVTESLPVPDKVWLKFPNDELEKGLGEKKYEVCEDKGESDCEVYLLDKSNTTLSVISEVLNSVYESSLGHYGSVFVGVMNKDWEEIKPVLENINGIGGGSARIRAEFFDSPLEILNYVGKKKRKRK